MGESGLPRCLARGCEVEFEQPRRGPTKLYCSDQCRNDEYYRRRTESSAKVGRTSKVMRAVVPWHIHRAFALEADQRRVDIDVLVAEAMNAWLTAAISARSLEAEKAIIAVLVEHATNNLPPTLTG